MPKGLVLWLLACLGIGLATAVAQKPRDVAEVAPDIYRVVFENDYVRVLEVRIAPGVKLPMHSHPALVRVALSPARAKIVFLDGRVDVVDQRPGEARWADAEEHSSVEVLAGTAHVILVEVKGARPKPKAPPA